jgi:hypothetical protein
MTNHPLSFPNHARDELPPVNLSGKKTLQEDRGSLQGEEKNVCVRTGYRDRGSLTSLPRSFLQLHYCHCCVTTAPPSGTMLLLCSLLLTAAANNANNETHSPERTVPGPRVMPVKKARIFLYNMMPALRHP